jgi:coenzyme F420 biosynthesis associated uncharacterized protein
MSSLVDWDVAARAAKRLSPPPPSVSRAEAEAAVSELYQSISMAAGHVAELTRLREPTVTATNRVVDRAAWIDTNTSGLRTVVTPLVDKLAEAHPVGRVAEAFGGKITGAQIGVVIGFLSGKVLGQFDFFDRPGGQLLLVAPNVVSVERQLGLDPRDFRLWVCLHEVTHRVQFTAVPWLRQYLLDQVQALTDGIGELVNVVRGKGDGTGLISIITTPEQRLIMDRLTAFMSLVEGHAEYVMNSVSPDVIPSQPQIEQRFAARRRHGGNPLDRLLRRLLGLDAKTRQYVDGAKFVRAVVDRVGLDDFNRVWTSRDTLPTKDEIARPEQWITRVRA